MIFKFFFLINFSLFFLSACATFQENQHEAAFSASYETVWGAAQITMEKYPIESLDYDSGKIVTERIKHYNIWKPPKGSITNTSNREYVISIFLLPGELDSSEAIKVQVLKEEFINKDFIEQSVPVPTNGLEEEVILYRISRNIHLIKTRKRLLKRSQKK